MGRISIPPSSSSSSTSSTRWWVRKRNYKDDRIRGVGVGEWGVDEGIGGGGTGIEKFFSNQIIFNSVSHSGDFIIILITSQFGTRRRRGDRDVPRAGMLSR